MPRSFSDQVAMRSIALAFLIFGVAVALPANAQQIYRWVDDRGVVNYANQPPETTNRAVRIDTQESHLTVIPAPHNRPENATLPPLRPVRAEFPSDVDLATMTRAHSALPPRRRSGELR